MTSNKSILAQATEFSSNGISLPGYLVPPKKRSLMKNGLSFSIVLLIGLLLGSYSIDQNRSRQNSVSAQKSLPLTKSSKTDLQNSLSKLPLSFEINQGQTDPQVKFLSRGAGYSFFLTPTEAVLRVNKHAAQKSSESKNSTDIVRMKIEGGNQAPQISGADAVATKSNYLRGDNARIPAVEHFSKVKYRDVYPGIDLVWYGNQQQLEHDWIVAPDTDPRRIQLSFSGVESLSVAGDGDLVLNTVNGAMLQHRPVIYQELNGEHHSINGRYVIKGEHQVGFEIDEYDTTSALIIDPILSYSTYLGGSGSSTTEAVMTVDASGNMYVAGVAASASFPVVNAGQPAFGGFGPDGIGDGFIAKLNPDGTALLFATYFGGSRDDEIFGIAVGADGGIYVTGDTASINFPLKNPIQSTFVGAQSGYYHAFVSKLTGDGSALVYSTFLGGSGFQDAGNSIAVDAAGNVYVAGYTNSTNFPLVNPLQSTYRGGDYDAFVVKINPTGSALLFSTFYGGSSIDEGGKIAVDDTGIYLNGITQSLNFPLQNALQTLYGGTGADNYGDGFVAKLSLDGSTIIFSTYLGGSGDDEIFSMALGADHSVYLVGDTSSTDFPLKNPLQARFSTALPDSYHAFITKLAPGGSALTYSTYLGGSGDTDVATSIAIDPAGCAYILGETTSTDFPLLNPLQATYKGGAADAFLAKLNPTGSALLFSTYLGGTNTDLGSDVRVDAIGNMYVAGLTASVDFPTRNPLQATNRGTANLFLMKLGADEVTVGGANFNGSSIVAKGIVSAFGLTLANTTAPAPTIPLPTTLGGTTVKVTDSTGTERLAPLFYVSPGQINYQIPGGTVVGPALVVITNGNGVISSGAMQVTDVAPTIFTLTQNGTGAAAALDAITFAPAPFNAKRPNGDPNIIAFYGTGLGADATDIDGNVNGSMQATIDGNPATVLYAGRAPGYVGLNQLNVVLTTNLAPGNHVLSVARNGVMANATTIEIK
jgi:uncharacterized protein (TIGR03437 family)